MSETQTPAGPWTQSIRLAFYALLGLTLLAAASWLFSNVRQIPADSRAVVLHFGAQQRIAEPGLLLSWPKPIDDVVMVPAPDRVIEHRVNALLRSPDALNADMRDDNSSDALAGSGYLLTGDAGVVQLDISVFYRVNSPMDYVLQGEHVIPALDRLVERAAVAVCSARDLDTILVARPEMVSNDMNVAQQRERLRADVQHNVEQNLQRLAQAGSSLGITLERVTVQSTLPATTVTAFNAVLTASQKASQAIATANTDASLIRQKSTQLADQTRQTAQAQAREKVAKAQADTAMVTRLANTPHDPDLLARVYRERIAAILAQAESVITVSPQDDANLILQAAGQKEPSAK
ncbi:SPFH domain-containing protein [Buttiauxella izardii]|uniref:Protease modulator HflK n=1 Tax=Buttiauxella izardii TaxID=82991 RepID=A0A3A5JKD6_9ENTR|nr:SPFH domain-containing protein [Buttiauxella izardii]RJT18743.1 protease modulator HflK [Buttiauxella izardii]